MSSRQQLRIGLTAPAQSEVNNGSWVKLEQLGMPDDATGISFDDLLAMFTMASGGVSAWLYDLYDCPFTINDDNTVTVHLDFYAWPSRVDLPYTMTTSIGVLREKEVVEMDREFDLIIPESDTVELPFVMSGVTLEWQTPAFNEDWRVIPRPAYTVNDASITFAEPCFGVVRVRGVAKGYKHIIDINLQTTSETLSEDLDVEVETYKVENLKCSATAHWQALKDETDPDSLLEFYTEIIELKIPPCVESYLTSCPNGNSKHVEVGITPNGGRHTVVYFSTCTGNIIMVRDEV